MVRLLGYFEVGIRKSFLPEFSGPTQLRISIYEKG